MHEGKRLVLVVNDRAITATNLKEKLEFKGFATLVAPTAAEALRLFDANSDLIDAAVIDGCLIPGYDDGGESGAALVKELIKRGIGSKPMIAHSTLYNGVLMKAGCTRSSASTASEVAELLAQIFFPAP